MAQQQMPYGMQSQREGLDRQRALYEALFARMASPQIPQNKGRMESRMSPIQPLMQVLGAYMANKKLGGLDERYAQHAQGVQSWQDEQAAKAAKGDQIKALTTALGSRAQPQALYDTITQQDPTRLDGQFHRPNITPHQINGAPGAMTTKPDGTQSFQFEPKQGTTVHVGGEKEAVSVRGDVRKELLKEKENLIKNPQAIRMAAEAQNLIDMGAQTGGGQKVFQALREFGDALGVEIPETGLTQSLLANLENRAISRAREVYPVTDKDLEAIRKMVGSVTTTEGALRYLTALDAASSYASLHEYNQKVASEQGNLDDPVVQRAYEGLKFRIPPMMQMPALAGQILQMWGIPVSVPDESGNPVPARFSLDPTIGGPAGSKPQSALPPGIRRRN